MPANRVLVTGFEAYGGRAVNPSAEIVDHLKGGSIGDIELHTCVLPVVNEGLQESVAELIHSVQPNAIVALGLCPGEAVIRLERLAANFSSFEIADNAGIRYRGPVLADAPAAYESTLPLTTIQQHLLEHGIPARISATAGAYLCNALMFHLLHFCSQHCPDCATGFVHLPLMPKQVCAAMLSGDVMIDSHHPGAVASMPFELQLNAIELAVSCLFR